MGHVCLRVGGRVARRVGMCGNSVTLCVCRYSDDEIETKVQDLRGSLLAKEMPPPSGKQNM